MTLTELQAKMKEIVNSGPPLSMSMFERVVELSFLAGHLEGMREAHTMARQFAEKDHRHD